MLVFCPEVRELFVRLGATSATGSITFQMLEESINSDAATQMQLFHVFFCMWPVNANYEQMWHGDEQIHIAKK